MKQRIAVGLSGGVDSALSAWLLKKQGHEVVGIFMKNWQDDDDREYCASAADFIDAVAVADVLGIDIEHVNFAAEYKERVFADFLDEYRAGRTPNPDIFCNAEIKFKAFLHHAMQGGFDAIATGHYARLARLDGRVALLKGSDPSKDQSYFLHRLDQAQLARAIFPLGDMHKSRVRELARELKLPNADKKDSTGICFIGERPFRDFLGRYIHSAPGPILDDQGRELGQHLGLPFYTLGQRSGLGIGGVVGALDAPWFVARKELAANVLRVVQGHDHPWLLARRLQAVRPHWICGRAPAPGCVHGCKTRYRQADCPARVLHASDEALELEFDPPQWAVTPGQSVVLYEGDVCLGGAIIAQTD